MCIEISPLLHSWIIDIDGTIFKHNAHLNGEDVLLDGVQQFWHKIPDEDFILLLTARHEKYKDATESALAKYNLRYNKIIFGIPTGERILINDEKPSGLRTAIAINIRRDKGLLDNKMIIKNNL